MIIFTWVSASQKFYGGSVIAVILSSMTDASFNVHFLCMMVLGNINFADLFKRFSLYQFLCLHNLA
jgi:hypothetical protein